MYDKDGNGKLDRHEVKRLIKVRNLLSALLVSSKFHSEKHKVKV